MAINKILPESKPEYLGSIVMNVLFLALANFVLDWSEIPFVTDGIHSVLSFLNIVLLGSIAGNLILFFHDKPGLRLLIRTLLNIVGVVFVIIFLRVFPIDLSNTPFSWFSSFLRFAIVMTGVAMVAGVLVEIYNTFGDK